MKCARRGGTLIYCMVMMTALCGIASLAVDLGRVQLAKTELQRCADAAARAAAQELATSLTSLQTVAQQYASANLVDGSAVALNTTNDIETGTWDSSTRTFTPTSFASANAVRITARRTAARGTAIPLTFAKVLGRNSCDVTAVAIATATMGGSSTYGFVGLNSFTTGTSVAIDSYKSASGSYDSSTALSNGGVASNGTWSIGSGTTISGNLYYRTSSAPSGGTVSGSRTKLGSDLSYSAATVPASYTDHGSLHLSGNNTLSLAAGNHKFTSLVLTGHATITCAPGTKIYCTGDMSVGNNCSVDVTSGIPKDLEIHMTGSGSTFDGSNNTVCHALLDAPLCTVNVNCDFYGSIVGQSISAANSVKMHYDETGGLAGSGSGGGGSSTTTSIAIVK